MDLEKNLTQEVEVLTERLEKAKHFFREQRKEIEELKQKNEEFSTQNTTLSKENSELRRVNEKMSEKNAENERFKEALTTQLKKVINDFSSFLDDIEK